MTGAEMRTFVAVELPWSDDLSEVVGRRLEQFHLTIRFLGEIPPDRAEAVARAIALATSSLPAFELELEGIGAFPNEQAPGVVWVGIGRGRGESEELARRVNVALAREGFPREERPFRPHATLFRVRRPPDRARAERAIGAGRGRKFGSTRVDEIGAFESVLTASGAEHRRFASAKLAGAA
jgi:2'-5' RNA ligase